MTIKNKYYNVHITHCLCSLNRSLKFPIMSFYHDPHVYNRFVQKDEQRKEEPGSFEEIAKFVHHYSMCLC